MGFQVADGAVGVFDGDGSVAVSDHLDETGVTVKVDINFADGAGRDDGFSRVVAEVSEVDFGLADVFAHFGSDAGTGGGVVDDFDGWLRSDGDNISRLRLNAAVAEEEGKELDEKNGCDDKAGDSENNANDLTFFATFVRFSALGSSFELFPALRNRTPRLN